MKSLIDYLNEKLIVNKNYTAPKYLKRGDEFTREYASVISKEIEKEYAKSYDSKNIMKNAYYLITTITNKCINQLIDANIYKFNGSEEDIKNSDEYIFSFEIFGIKNIIFTFYVFEDHFSIITLKYAKVSQLKEIEPILNKCGYEMFKNANIIPFSWDSPYLFISTETFIDIDSINELLDTVYQLVQGLKPDDLSKLTVGPGEVLPGWTIDDIKKRYDSIFDDVCIMRSGNVKLGHLKEKGKDSSYEHSTFRIDTNFKYRNGIMIGRRLDGGSGSGNNFVLEPTVDKAFDELDKKLRKKGYKI